jgi:hypothetical protein
MNVSKLRRLLRHRAGNLSNAVPDGDHRGAPRSIQVPPAFRRIDKTSLGTHRLWVRLQETSRENGFIRHLRSDHKHLPRPT